MQRGSFFCGVRLGGRIVFSTQSRVSPRGRVHKSQREIIGASEHAALKQNLSTFSINYFIKTDMVCACVLSVGVRTCLSVFVMQKVKFHSIKKGVGGKRSVGFRGLISSNTLVVSA